MVYCTKCGAKNEEGAAECVKCGASLETARPPRRHERRRKEEECFGIPHGGAVVGLAFGVIILLWGLVALLQQIVPDFPTIDLGAFIAIVIGTLIIIGAYFGLRRRY